METKASVRAAPIVRAAAKQDGVDLSRMQGTGKNGWITKGDYERATGKKIGTDRSEKPPEMPTEEQERRIVASAQEIVRDAAQEQRVAYTPRIEEERAPLHHLREDVSPDSEMEIGGMRFRRTRTGLDHSYRKTVDIPEKCKNNELHYRVVTDDRGKLQNAKALGYEKVDNMVDPDTGEKIETRYRMGTKKDGSDLYGYLMATPKKWLQERRDTAEKERRAREEGMFMTPEDEQGRPLGDNFYNKGSRIE